MEGEAINEHRATVLPKFRSRTYSGSNYSDCSDHSRDSTDSTDTIKTISRDKLPKGSDIFQKVLDELRPKPVEVPVKAERPIQGIMSKSTRAKQKASLRAVACTIRFKKMFEASHPHSSSGAMAKI
ncbi:hypothetical protein KP79_PYT08436 [Mizuhopecten yessoensis]|uniref:Uncharacterized protein n=1 Tax=Mizuhopecten yessoensis TaxID=6573 RepID=A0A210QYD0_MIZYE|nr:hypothetical protein KP79_PYT08436 [Mizuhopecten yessoensis]